MDSSRENELYHFGLEVLSEMESIPSPLSETRIRDEDGLRKMLIKQLKIWTEGWEPTPEWKILITGFDSLTQEAHITVHTDSRRLFLVLSANGLDAEMMESQQEAPAPKKKSSFQSRPWGYMKTLWAPSFAAAKVKVLSINPGASLSLQMHRSRGEHWVLIAGYVKVTFGKGCSFPRNLEQATAELKTGILSPGMHAHIPVGTVHRVTNVGSVPAFLVEVQYGQVCDEDDIVRFVDDYGRVEAEELPSPPPPPVLPTDAGARLGPGNRTGI